MTAYWVDFEHGAVSLSKEAEDEIVDGSDYATFNNGMLVTSYRIDAPNKTMARAIAVHMDKDLMRRLKGMVLGLR